MRNLVCNVKRSLRVMLAATVGGWGLGMAHPVGDALERPALQVRAPAQSVLMAVARAGDRLVAVGERGVIVRSEDQGKTWQQAPSPVSVTLAMVRFADAQHGVAVGHGGTVLTTQDGGAHWKLRLDGHQLARIAQRDAADEAQRVDAERLVADGADKPFLDVQMWDAQRILAVGAYGLVFFSPDGGANWYSWMGRVPNPHALHWYAVRREGDTLLLAGEQGVLARSQDAGQHFESMESPYRGSWFSAELQTGGRMVLAGLRGNVWTFGEAGQRWTQLSIPVPASIMATARNADGSLLLANQAGVVMRQQGERVDVLTPVPIPAAAGLLSLADGRVVTVGIAGVVPLPAASSQTGARP